jgi:hypothetical protein
MRASSKGQSIQPVREYRITVAHLQKRGSHDYLGNLVSANNLIFSLRESFFIAASRALAILRVRHFFVYTNVTGRRVRVYFAPFDDELCSANRRCRFVVIPVYRVPSAHATIYTVYM